MTAPTVTSMRLCVESGRPQNECLGIGHAGTACTTGLYLLSGGVVDPIDQAVRDTIEHSHDIRRDIERGAYTADLVRHILVEAIDSRAVLINITRHPDDDRGA